MSNINEGIAHQKTRRITSTITVVHIAGASISVSSVLYIVQTVQMCASLINENKVEETHLLHFGGE